MKISALATDYDGTLARHGEMSASTVAALARFKETGRKLFMVTGRELGDLKRVCPVTNLFDRIVAENGALIHNPQTGLVREMAARPPRGFAAELRARNVHPLSLGQVIVATEEKYYTTIQEVIHEMSLPLHISLNKGALMVLPDGVNKAAGLEEVFEEFELSPDTIAGVGDAENDFSFLSVCGLSAAVANALPELKKRVDLTTKATHGAGVEEFIERIMNGDGGGERKAKDKRLKERAKGPRESWFGFK